MKRSIIPYNPNLKKLAQELRNKSTPSEIRLWVYLKGRKFHGYTFNRQKPLLNFIVDFYCYDLKLVIELDGYSHQLEEIQEKDLAKQEALEEHNLTVLRFHDKQVFEDIDNVLRVIEHYIIKQENV